MQLLLQTNEKMPQQKALVNQWSISHWQY